jgi:hypothetical protein
VNIAQFNVSTTRSKKRGSNHDFIRPFTSNLLTSPSAVTSVAPGPYPADEPLWAISSQKKLRAIIPDRDMIEHRSLSDSCSSLQERGFVVLQAPGIDRPDRGGEIGGEMIEWR